ncbi:MAG: hypothetical protein M3Y69_11130 [Verrucomicrobiota bacterium]|nr:hypothetical protein [Verrucomicrobiota bacterium]
MDIGSVACHVEFYTESGAQVEEYLISGFFVCPRAGERVHLHHGSLVLDITRVVHDLVEHEGAHLEHTVKIYGEEVTAVE